MGAVLEFPEVAGIEPVGGGVGGHGRMHLVGFLGAAVVQIPSAPEYAEIQGDPEVVIALSGLGLGDDLARLGPPLSIEIILLLPCPVPADGDILTSQPGGDGFGLNNESAEFFHAPGIEGGEVFFSAGIEGRGRSRHDSLGGDVKAGRGGVRVSDERGWWWDFGKYSGGCGALRLCGWWGGGDFPAWNPQWMRVL